MKAIACVAVVTSALLFLTPAHGQPEGNGAQGSAPNYENRYDDWTAAMANRNGSGIDRDYDRGPEAGGAHLRLVHGDSKIDVKCPPDESFEDCVNAAIILMDHVAKERKRMAEAKRPHGGSAERPGTAPAVQGNPPSNLGAQPAEPGGGPG